MYLWQFQWNNCTALLQTWGISSLGAKTIIWKKYCSLLGYEYLNHGFDFRFGSISKSMRPKNRALKIWFCVITADSWFKNRFYSQRVMLLDSVGVILGWITRIIFDRCSREILILPKYKHFYKINSIWKNTFINIIWIAILLTNY